MATLKMGLGKWQAQRSSNSYLKTEAGTMAGEEVEALGKWQAQRLSNSYLKTGAGTMAGEEVQQ